MPKCGIDRPSSHACYRSAALGTIQDALTRFAGGRGDCPSPPMRSPSEPNQDGMTPMVADTARWVTETTWSLIPIVLARSESSVRAAA